MRVPTSAGVRVLRLCWSPWQVIVEISAALTVQSFCIMFAHTAAVDLADKKEIIVKEISVDGINNKALTVFTAQIRRVLSVLGLQHHKLTMLISRALTPGTGAHSEACP